MGTRVNGRSSRHASPQDQEGGHQLFIYMGQSSSDLAERGPNRQSSQAGPEPSQAVPVPSFYRGDSDDMTYKAIAKSQAMARGLIARKRLRQPPMKVLVIMDPGQDLDDEMFLVMLRALADRKLVECLGVVTTLAPSEMRAELARGTLRELGMQVPVGAGSDGGSKGDTAMMEGLEYMVEGRITEHSGMGLMRSVLEDALPNSITMVIVSSLKDMAELLQSEEALCVKKLKEVVIMGGVQPCVPGGLLEPDSAHNNMFDVDSSKFVHEQCQQVGKAPFPDKAGSPFPTGRKGSLLRKGCFPFPYR